jgi:hypothetical protein
MTYIHIHPPGLIVYPHIAETFQIGVQQSINQSKTQTFTSTKTDGLIEDYVRGCI